MDDNLLQPQKPADHPLCSDLAACMLQLAAHHSRHCYNVGCRVSALQKKVQLAHIPTLTLHPRSHIPDTPIPCPSTLHSVSAVNTPTLLENTLLHTDMQSGCAGHTAIDATCAVGPGLPAPRTQSCTSCTAQAAWFATSGAAATAPAAGTALVAPTARCWPSGPTGAADSAADSAAAAAMLSGAATAACAAACASCLSCSASSTACWAASAVG
jgi:hypothetical protein